MTSEHKQLKFKISHRQILSCIRDSILVVDRDGIILFINYVLPGYEEDKVIGTSVYDYLHASHHARIQKKMKHTWDTGKDGMYEVEYEDEMGREISYETRIHAYRPNGKTECIVQIARDMTLGHKRKEELELRKNELESFVELRTRELMELNYQLSQKNNTIKEVLSQLEEEKKNLEQNIVSNFETILMPILARLKQSGIPEQSELFTLMENKLKNITSSYGLQISSSLKRLTPSEIQVCNLIRAGMKTKDIARILKCSHLTIDTHRTKIRKKLGISNQQVNLETYLQNLK